jgi:ADP-ribosylglycohydrolase
LACFTVEGLIRACVRGSHKGICHPPSVVWHAYCRWAAGQGIERERFRRRWAPGGAGQVWPDGWLADVPVLAERRGSAPATVTALTGLEQGTVERPVTASRGCHALTRTLPVGVLPAGREGSAWVRWAGELAALTHGDAAAQSAAAAAAVLVGHCLHGASVPHALAAGTEAVQAARDLPGGLAARLAGAREHAERQPADPARLALLAPDATAEAVLLGGVYVAASFPDRADAGAALRFAAGAPHGEGVGCVTGALLGAAHGADALPTDLVSRLELAWVLDVLARDLVAELTDSPGGGEYTEAKDPSWPTRYPGW